MNYYSRPGIQSIKKRMSHFYATRIIETVSKVSGISINKMIGNGRVSERCEARQIAMYIMKKRTSLSLVYIGNLFNRHHSTVIHATRKIQDLLDSGDRIITIIDKIYSIL